MTLRERLLILARSLSWTEAPALPGTLSVIEAHDLVAAGYAETVDEIGEPWPDHRSNIKGAPRLRLTSAGKEFVETETNRATKRVKS